MQLDAFQVRIVLFLALFFGVISNSVAQDIHFSRFWDAPMSLNAASPAAMEEECRGIVNYRTQWGSIVTPYETFGASFEKRIALDEDNFGVGIRAFQDNSGQFKIPVTKLSLSIAYGKRLGTGMLLSVGVQPGFVQKRSDLSTLTLPNQWNNQSGTYDPASPSGETFSADDIAYFDLNTGVVLNKQSKSLDWEVGTNFFHVLSPEESYIVSESEPTNKLPLRTSTYASATLKPLKVFHVKPQLFFGQTTGTTETIGGAQMIFPAKQDYVTLKYISVGGFYRLGDAAIVTAGARLKKIAIGLSYDITMSDLSSSANTSAFEIALRYDCSFAPEMKIKQVPCKRY